MRLEPLKNEEEIYPIIVSVGVSKRMAEMMVEEQKRVGVKSRSELCRLIFEQYFSQEIENTEPIEF